MKVENNIEEDIKILEEIKDMFIHLKNYGWINDIKKDIDTDKAIRTIEHLIEEHKDLKEIEESHRRENGELREKVKKLEEENKTLNERNQYLVKYRAKLESDRFIRYRDLSHKKEFCFYKIAMKYECDSEYRWVDMPELQAINEKVKELRVDRKIREER